MLRLLIFTNLPDALLVLPNLIANLPDALLVLPNLIASIFNKA